MLSNHVVKKILPNYVWFRDDVKLWTEDTENHAEEDEEFTIAMQRAMNAMSPKAEVMMPLEGGKAHQMS